jgi:predicted phage tail component-like protein
VIENVENIIFDGTDLANVFTNQEEGTYFIVNNVYGRGVQSVENTLTHVAGMDGSYPSSSRLASRRMTIDITMKGTSFNDLRKRIEQLNEILFTRNIDVPIVFNDEPDRVYYGRIDEVTDTIESSYIYQAQLTVICSDPFKYGEEKKLTFSSDIVSFTNQGTAEADPIFEMEVLKPTTFAMVQNQDEQYQMIGRPVDADSTPFEAEELIMHKRMSSTSDWTAASQVDNGVVSGTMVSDGNGFVVQSFGTQGQAKWYGPALKTSLPETLQDFRMEARVENLNGRNQVGKVEIYLLDINNNILARISMADVWQGYYRNRAASNIRNNESTQSLHRLAETTAEAQGELWNNFDGILRIERVGERWSAYVAKVGNGNLHSARETKNFIDVGNEFQQQVAQIQVHIGIFDNYSPTAMRIKDLKVWKINNPDDHQIPYIVYAGDVITLDHRTSEILINGEPRTDLKDFGGQYFKLTPGGNQVIVQPSDSFNTNMKYLERYR